MYFLIYVDENSVADRLIGPLETWDQAIERLETVVLQEENQENDALTENQRDTGSWFDPKTVASWSVVTPD